VECTEFVNRLVFWKSAQFLELHLFPATGERVGRHLSLLIWVHWKELIPVIGPLILSECRGWRKYRNSAIQAVTLNVPPPVPFRVDVYIMLISVVVWGTVLQAARFRVRVLMRWIFVFNLPNLSRPPLWSTGQRSWLHAQRTRVRFPALPDFLRSSGSGTGSTQPREDNWGATWMEK
jgi:hypothetical protein